MNRIGTKLLEQSKGDKLFHRKDILSVLAQANSMEEKAHQMNDEDVRSRAYKPMLDWCTIYSCILSEIPTFIVAGHETTRYTSVHQSFCNRFLILGAVSRCVGRYMLYLKTKTFKRNFVTRYLTYLLRIQQWMI